MKIYNKFKFIPLEEFVNIPGFNGHYQINKLGQIKTIERSIYRNGFLSHGKTREMKIHISKHGYKAIGLIKNGNRKLFTLHRLLAITFIPNPKKYRVVRHINDIKLDNRIENLSWGTHQDNAKDACRNNKMVNKRLGEHGNAKLVFDTQMGIFYNSVIEAATAKRLVPNNLCRKLRGERRNNTGMLYV